MWVGRRTLKLLRLLFPERSGRPEAPSSSGPQRLWSVPRLPGARQAPGLGEAVSGQGAVGTAAWVPRCQAAHRARPLPPIQLRSRGWQRRAPLGGRSAAESGAREGRGEPQPPPPAQTEEGASRRGAGPGAGRWAPLPAYSIPAARSPGLGGLRPWQPAVLCAPLAPGCVKRQAGAAQRGSPDSFFSFPWSRRVELEANPSRTCAPINSARVPASRSPGCARTEKVVRRDSGRAAEAGEDPTGRAAPHLRTDPGNSCFPCWGSG